MKNNKVLIFRQQLFKPSETFITTQGENLKRYEPIYIGRKIFGTPVAGAKYELIAKQSLFGQIFYQITRSPIIEDNIFFNKDIKLVHAHFAIDGVYALPIARKLNIPLVVTLHGFDVTRTSNDMLLSLKPSFYNYLILREKLWKEVDLFICVSDFIKQKAIEVGFPKEKLITHYIGIDVEKFIYRKKLPDKKIVLHVARLVEKKGTTFLLKALFEAKKTIPDIKLIIIGEGPLRQALVDEVNLLNLNDNVEFLGVQPNSVVKEWLNKASVMCVPSVIASNGDAEGLGIVNLEAAAMGVPVIAFNSGGIPEAVLNNKTGYLVEEKNYLELSKKMIDLLESKELADRISKNAREFILSNHNQIEQCRKLEDIYNLIVGDCK